MALDNVNVPEPSDPEDLLAAWRGQVRELESLPEVQPDSEGELLSQLRAIADDLARGPVPATPLLVAGTEQAEALSEAIALADAAQTTDDTVMASPFDFAALTTAISTLEGAASTVLTRAEGEFADVRESVKAEVLAIRETLAAELKALREEFQKSHRRAARRSTDGGPRLLTAANETPLLAKLNEACTQLETLRTQTQRLAESLPQWAFPRAAASPNADASSQVTDALAQLQQFVENAVVSLRQDLDAYAASVESHANKARRSADLSATATEEAIANLQARVVAAVSDADQRLARLTANVQSTAERAERSASQVEAAFAATAALRVEATSAVGNWRDEALRIVRDALSRMATETAGAANQAREARKTVIAETRTLRSELLKHAESAHADVLSEVRRELGQTRAAFAEQRQQLAIELSALEEARRQHEQLAADSRTDVNRSVAESATTTRQQVERLDAAYRDLRAHLDEVRAANARVVAAVESIEARAAAEFEPLTAARQHSDELTAALRAQIGETLAELRDARIELEEHHGAAIDSIAATHAALTDELTRTIDLARDQLSAAHGDLRRHVEEVRTANDLVVNLAESIEATVNAELEPLADVRRQSREVSIALREEIRSALGELDAMQGRLAGTNDELRTAYQELHRQIEDVTAANAQIVAAAESMHAQATAHLVPLTETREQLSAAHHDLRKHADEVRAANELVVTVAGNIESKIVAQIEPLAELRRESHEVTRTLREQIEGVLTELRDTQGELQEQQRSALGSITATQTALTTEVQDVASARRELSATHQELRKHLDEVRAANELLVNVAENVEWNLKAQIEPLVEARRQSQELAAALQDEVREAARALEETRLHVGVSDEELRAARERLTSAEKQLSAARHRVDESSDRLVAASDTIEQRIEAVHRLETAYQELRKHVEEGRATDVQRLNAVFSDFHAHLQETRDELRAANELVVHAAESVEARANAELAPLADVRRRSEELAETFDALIATLPRETHAKIDAAIADLSTATDRIQQVENRINAAAESTEARVRDEIDGLAKARTEYEAAIERFRGDARASLDDARAHQERTVASLAKEFRSIAEQRRAEFLSMFDEMRGQFGAALSAITASNAEAKADANAHVSGLAHDLRTAVEQQVRAASHEIRAELEVVVNALRDQLDRVTIAEHEAVALRDAADSKQAREDGAALQRAVGMLSVLESLDDALQSLQSEPSPEARRRIDQFERQAREMAQLVELQEIPTDGDVDEERHEIVAVDSKQGEFGRIVEVRQRGYVFRGRVVRRAQVVVGGASAAAARAHAAAQLSS